MAHIRAYTNMLPQSVRFTLRKLYFRGENVVCELCGSHVREFKSHGGGAEVLESRRVVGGMSRPDDRCPVCHGRDRTRLIKHYLETEAGLGARPLSILHVAPDFGLHLWLSRQRNVTHLGCDLDQGRYRHIDNFREVDLTRTPFEDNTFDVVICSHVFEHIPDDAAAFGELFRILKPGGRALLLVPFATDGAGTDEDLSVIDPGERDRRYGQWDHVRLYDREGFMARMRTAGFEVELYDPSAKDPDSVAREKLNPLELMPVGHKPVPQA